MGWPTVSDLVYVFGPDLDGRRIEEVADPSRLAGEAAERMTDRVVDEVVERSGFAQPEAEPPLPDAGMQAEPEAGPTRPVPPLSERLQPPLHNNSGLPSHPPPTHRPPPPPTHPTPP